MECKCDLHHGDCLELMRDIPDNSIDLILCDPPYGTTACDFDTIIPLEPMWEQTLRVAKENAAILMFSQQPFTTDLINSNRKLFRYEIIWEKTQPLGFLSANKMPLRAHEVIAVFYRKLPTYNPQKQYVGGNIGRKQKERTGRVEHYGNTRTGQYIEDGYRYPTDVLKFSNRSGSLFGGGDKAQHPTRKPVKLLEYLIATYSNEGDTVLDFCMGSGSTGEAAWNMGRSFIGIELDDNYFAVASERLERVRSQMSLFVDLEGHND